MRRVGLLVLAVALLAGCGGSGDGGGGTAAEAAPELSDVASVEEFRERFNADQGLPRLVVLAAPT